MWLENSHHLFLEGEKSWHTHFPQSRCVEIWWTVLETCSLQDSSLTQNSLFLIYQPCFPSFFLLFFLFLSLLQYADFVLIFSLETSSY